MKLGEYTFKLALKRRRGQSEIIGGIIMLTVTLLVIGMLYMTLLRTSYRSTEGFADRAVFESERGVERLVVDYDTVLDKCVVKNPGPLNVTIIRAWIRLSSPENAVEPVETSIALPIERSMDSLRLDSGYSVSLWDTVSVVTSRGNVFPISGLCYEIKQSLTNKTVYGVFSKENTLGDETYLNLTKYPNWGMYANITTSDGVTAKYSVAYRFKTNWYINSGEGWQLTSNAPTLKDNKIDGDGNGINEIVIVESNKEKDLDLKGNIKVEKVELIFRDFIDMSATSDFITIYFKLVVYVDGAGRPHEATSGIYVVLVNATGALVTVPATMTTFGSSGWSIIVGTAMIPREAFSLYREKLAPGTYSLIIGIQLAQTDKLKIQYIRLETFATAGVSIKPPRS